jgi:hypothetical protein
VNWRSVLLHGALFASSVLAACAPAPPPPSVPRPAFGEPGLAGRIDAVESQIAEAGGEVAGRWGPLFLTQAAVHPQHLALAGGRCWLLLGLAGARIADLDLAVYGISGRKVGEDAERDAHPVVVLCPQQDEFAVAVLAAYEGAGEAFLGLYRFPADRAPERGALEFAEAPPPPPEEGEETLDDAVLRMDRLLGAEGFRRAGDTEEIEFEDIGEVARPHRVPAGRCLGVGLVGIDAGSDLDLRLNLGSRKVAEDRAATRDAHVAWCSPTEVDVRVYASSANGPARATLLFYEASPDERVFVTPTTLPDEPRAEGAGDRPTLEQAAADLDRELRAGGYVREGSPFEGTLAGSEHADFPLTLARGVCYEVAGFARPNGIRDLDLMLDDASGNRVAEDREEDNEPRVAFCPETSGTYTLDVHAYDGAGGYAAYVYRLAPQVRDIPGVGGRLASAYSRLAASLHGAAFHAMGTPNQMPAEPGRKDSHTLPLHYGSCYVVAAFASRDDMDIDLEVRDYLLRSVSVDVAGDADARVYVCPDRTADFYATVTVANGRGLYLLAVFESKAE